MITPPGGLPGGGGAMGCDGSRGTSGKIAKKEMKNRFVIPSLAIPLPIIDKGFAKVNVKKMALTDCLQKS